MGNELSSGSPRHSDASHDASSPPSSMDRARQLGAQLQSNFMNQTTGGGGGSSGKSRRRRSGDDDDQSMAIFDNMCGNIRDSIFDSSSKKGERRRSRSGGNYSDHSDDYSDLQSPFSRRNPSHCWYCCWIRHCFYEYEYECYW